MADLPLAPHPIPAPSRSGRLLLVIPAVLFSIVVGAWALTTNGDEPENTPASQQPAPAEKEEPKEEEKPDIGENPFPNRPAAPSLEGGTGWLNTSNEITLKELRGKVVLLDFWTYCCINCLHVLPDLKYLEEKFDKELVVIGVHSAKFDNEKDSENIRRAIMRYEIEHPVINDSEMLVWRKFGAHAWPTLVLIDPEGNYCGYISGEGHREILEEILTRLVKYHKAKGTLDETPIRFDLEQAKAKPTPLRFPGKVLADETGNRLFISDSNHNRIVITDLEGNLQTVIGSGAIGSNNGSFAEATFDHPQGVALAEEKLYVADTENHLIRVIDLKEKTVSTLAGTGEQAGFREPGGELNTTSLNSPWDIYHREGMLYIAMAGPHQIWSHKIGSNEIQVYAGNGREDVLDGTLEDSSLAQPSGLTADEEWLYVADSEGSSIRRVPFDLKGKVTTVVGERNLPRGATLFEFGDKDGKGLEVRLQHPLGVAWHKDGTLYVADTYNHKIKKVNLETEECVAWLGSGKAGDKLDPVQFSEPSGLSLIGDKLYIADTNNHRICVADVKTGKVTELALQGLTSPEKPAAGSKAAEDVATAAAVQVQTIQAGKELSVEIELALPEGYKVNELAPVTYQVQAKGEQKLIAAEHLGQRQEAQTAEKTISLTIPVTAEPGEATIELEVSYTYCRTGKGGLCRLGEARWSIPLKATAEPAANKLALKSSASAE